MKRFMAAALSVLVLGLSAVGCSGNKTASSGSSSNDKKANTSDISVGFCVYKFDDTFMTSVRNQMQKEATKEGVKLDVVDSQNKQATQNEQVDAFITKGVSALVVNPVDRTAAESIVEKAKAKNLPVIFINREPEETVMKSYDKIWYVGAKAEQSGGIQGQLMIDYFKKNKSADKNGNGAIDYVMLQGEPGHQDATLRTKYSIQTVNDSGMKTVKLAADTAYWDKAKATDLMNNFITSKGVDKIEAVFANNDDMALGAIESLKAHGYNKGDASKFIPVVGVDATTPGLAAIQDGLMYGTAYNNGIDQGIAAMRIAVAAAQNKTITKDTAGFEVTSNKYVWIPYEKVTKDNCSKYMSK